MLLAMGEVIDLPAGRLVVVDVRPHSWVPPDGSRPIFLDDVKVGDVVAGVWDPVMKIDVSSLFERAVSVDGRVQQLAGYPTDDFVTIYLGPPRRPVGRPGAATPEEEKPNGRNV